MWSVKYVVHVGYYVALGCDEEWGDVWSGNLLNQLALVPKDIKVFLENYILYPMKTHIHSLGEFLFDALVGNSHCGGITNCMGVGGWG